MDSKVGVSYVPVPNEPIVKRRFLEQHETDGWNDTTYCSVRSNGDKLKIYCVPGAKEPKVKQKWRESTGRSDDNVAVIYCFTGRE